MSKKKKVKLNSQQERHLKVLKKYLEEHECWTGDKDLRELMLDGPIVVLSVRSPIFDTAISCDTISHARAICKHNPDAHSRVIDLETDQILWEEEKGWMLRTKRDL